MVPVCFFDTKEPVGGRAFLARSRKKSSRHRYKDNKRPFVATVREKNLQTTLCQAEVFATVSRYEIVKYTILKVHLWNQGTSLRNLL